MDTLLIELFFIGIIVAMSVYMFLLIRENERLKKREIKVTCPEPRCPDLPPIPDCPPCRPCRPCRPCPKCPTTRQIADTIFPGRAVNLDESYASAYKDDSIQKGSRKLNRPVNTIDSDYIVNKQSLEMEQIKQKLKDIAQGGSLPPPIDTSPQPSPTTGLNPTTSPTTSS